MTAKMTPGKVESKIQREIIQYLRGRDRCYVINIGGGASTATGTPDLLVCYRSWFIGLEVKRPDGSYGTTEAQAIRMKQIRDAGGVARVVTSVAEAKDTLDYVDWMIQVLENG